MDLVYYNRKLFMFTNENIVNLEIDGIEYSAIVFDNKNTDLPAALLTGEKKPSYLFEDGKVEQWYWKNFSSYNGSKCLYFDKISLHPLAELSTTLRNKAPLLINNLAKALNQCSTEFLDLRGGIVSAWRIYFTDTNGVLILSSNLGDIFSSTNTEETRFANTSSLIHSGIHPSFTLIDEIAQLYYFAALGIKPFEDDTVREIGYRAIPLAVAAPVLCPEIDKDMINKIDGILSLKMGKQREISGNLDPQKALEWFYTKIENESWNLPNRDKVPDVMDILMSNEKTSAYLKSTESNAKKRIFWRTKGTVLIIVSVIVIFVGSFIFGRVKDYLAPPYTAGQNQEQIIESYYNAQNDLDIEKLEDSLARGVDSPISNEVTTLFVTRQTRMAYENSDTIINPVTWEEEGRPAINSGSYIYGVDDIKIEDIGNNNYKATSIFYSPDNYTDSYTDVDEDDIEVESDTTPIYRFEQIQVFTIEMTDKGWYEITAINPISVKYVDTLLVPIIKQSTASLVDSQIPGATTTEEAATKVTEVYVDPYLKKVAQQSTDMTTD